MTVLALVGAAWAVPVAVVARAPVAVGERAEIEILAAAGPAGVDAAPMLAIEGGELVGVTMVAPGHWRAEVRVERADGAILRLEDADHAQGAVRVDVARGIPCVLAPAAAEAEPHLLPGSATGRVHVRFPLRTSDAACATRVPADAVVVRASEGRVAEMRVVDDVLDVAVDVAADRIARNIVVAVLETGIPGLEPVVGSVALHGKPSLAVQAEPSSTATVKIGRRSFGPFVANDLGTIDVSLDTVPADTTYEITVTDSVGNTRRATGPLPGAVGPAVVVAEDAPGRAGWIVARTTGGQPWTGGPPRCAAASGGRVAAYAAHGAGVWRVPSLEEGLVGFDLRYACSIADTHVELRVPARGATPARIDLRAYPDVLSADVPVGQVVATLVTADGLPVAFLPASVASPGAPRLTARHGALVAEGAPVGQARASYRGEEARPFGEDLVTARWSVPAVTTGAWSLELVASGRGATAEAHARVLAADGAPVEGREIELVYTSTDAAAGSGFSARGRTDARGWFTAEGPVTEGTTVTVVARVPDVNLEARRFIVPGESVLLPSAERPDLETSLVLPIRAGRVREVVLEPSARSVRRGEAITLRVELRDANGGRVGDEPVRLVASEGGAVALARQDDGTWRGTYVAPTGDDPAVVTFGAESGEVRTEALVEVVPRPFRGAAAFAVGVQREGSRVVMVGAASVAVRGPGFPEALALRTSVAVHEVARSVDDLVSGETIDVRATIATLDLGAEVVRRFGRTNVALGGGVACAPYQLVVDYGGRRGTEGAGVTGPGAVARTRLGYRIGAAEVHGELAWTFLPLDAPSVRFDGGVGGASLVAGYRLSW